jgi:hypothetical protein
VPQTYETGRYIVVSSPGIVPRIIERITRSSFSHAAQIVSTGGDIIEAMPGGVRRAHISEYAGRRMLINSDPMSSGQQAALVAAAEAMVAVSYNDLAIVDDGLESLGVRWSWLARLANADHETICSQLVALIGVHAGYDWLCGKQYASEVRPADLARRPGMRPLTVIR